MSKKPFRPFDSNKNPISVMQLNDSHDIADGEQSDAIDGTIVRICATDGAIRFLIGADPTALTTSHFLADQAEIYQPCNVGDKVSVKGGPANISTCGV